MSLMIYFILVFVVDVVFAEQHKCTSAYRPSDHKGQLRVPKNCNVEKLNCPPSWKAGIPEGGETDPPMVYQAFLTCHEGFTLCGYVPIDPKNGEVLGNSGVTVGAGVDLGSKSKSSFSSLSSTLVNKLEPYFGLNKNLAACAAIERPLILTSTEANAVTDVIKNDMVSNVASRYNADKDKNALVFASVPRGIRTAIVSVWYQFGNPTNYPKFWDLVKKNDWEGAVKELRNFYTNPEKQARGNLNRRNNEADIIEATFAKCNRSVDVIFLLDESGSVSSSNFVESLVFVKNMIKSFPNEKLKGKDGTRFGLSTFSSSYTPHFYLSSYTNTSNYLAAIDRVRKNSGGTRLGAALGQILVDQFTEARGLRPEADGLPRILIVLTDGRSSDSVSIPAKNVRDKNIVVYAMGIGGYDLNQLRAIASSESHVYTLSNFVQLEKFITTLTSSTCYEPRPVSLNTKVKTVTSKDEYQYFSYKVNVSLNLELNIVDLAGSTFVYASRTNPHPYKYDYDISFDLAKQKIKIIVISATQSRMGKPSPVGEPTIQIYVSVTSDTNSAEFTIEGNECNPLTCTEGTNEIRPTVSPTTLLTTQLHMTCAASGQMNLLKITLLLHLSPSLVLLLLHCSLW